ncbi:uncharacterized protein LOC103679969 isoform X2 [Ursus maritimus]|uniref:Uncharacterized protein LOC103679969 isoform X2 n=1 Tax=Ursus maritimus TaxID=29073 RepID=A0A8M1F5A1_URSMA|nr:uncharacterized protein LOC103679969 isoform X2 [Ursus maritimus]
MPGTPGGRAGSGRGRVGLCVESAAGAAGVLWEAPGFGEEGGTLFQAGGGQHGQSDPEATEVGLWPLEAGIDADAGRRRQVGHHLPEVRSQARPGPPTWRSGSASSLAKRGNRGQDEAFTPRMLETVRLSAASGRLCTAWGVLPAPGSGRRWPSVSREGGPHQALSLPAPSSWTSSLWSREKSMGAAGPVLPSRFKDEEARASWRPHWGLTSQMLSQSMKMVVGGPLEVLG